MKQKYLFLLLLAGLSATPFGQASADPPVTFDVLTTFNYPGATSTLASGINDNGDVAGYFELESGIYRGFVRYRDHFSDPIKHPADQLDSTRLTDINNAGTVSGYYQQIDGHWHSFLAAGSTFADIDIGALETFVFGLNDAGHVCGYTSNAIDDAFVIIDGTVTFFEVPGADFTTPVAMNNLNQCVGFYSSEGGWFGFLRDADGTLTYPISASSSGTTFLYGINDNGSMVGTAADRRDVLHAVFIPSLGKAARYDYPGAFASSFWGINNRGQISGNYGDLSGSSNMIVRVRPAPAN